MLIDLSALEVQLLKYALSKAIKENNDLMIECLAANPNLENDLHPLNVRMADLHDLLSQYMEKD